MRLLSCELHFLTKTQIYLLKSRQIFGYHIITPLIYTENNSELNYSPYILQFAITLSAWSPLVRLWLTSLEVFSSIKNKQKWTKGCSAAVSLCKVFLMDSGQHQECAIDSRSVQPVVEHMVRAPDWTWHWLVQSCLRCCSAEWGRSQPHPSVRQVPQETKCLLEWTSQRPQVKTELKLHMCYSMYSWELYFLSQDTNIYLRGHVAMEASSNQYNAWRLTTVSWLPMAVILNYLCDGEREETEQTRTSLYSVVSKLSFRSSRLDYWFQSSPYLCAFRIMYY